MRRMRIGFIMALVAFALPFAPQACSAKGYVTGFDLIGWDAKGVVLLLAWLLAVVGLFATFTFARSAAPILRRVAALSGFPAFLSGIGLTFYKAMSDFGLSASSLGDHLSERFLDQPAYSSGLFLAFLGFGLAEYEGLKIRKTAGVETTTDEPAVYRRCPACQHEAPAELLYCAQCGAALHPDTPDEAAASPTEDDSSSRSPNPS